jgi:antitoxin VapB
MKLGLATHRRDFRLILWAWRSKLRCIIFNKRIGTVESTAKIFQNGRSQAVRLPKAFRFKGSEVKIRKEGDKVILEPLPKDRWPQGFWDDFAPDPDFPIPKPLPRAMQSSAPVLKEKAWLSAKEKPRMPLLP